MLGTGRRSRRDHLDIYWARGDAELPRLGLVVSRLGQTAVARNRLRRRLRELWRRELQGMVPPLDVVIRTRKESYRASFAALRADLVGWAQGVGD